MSREREPPIDEREWQAQERGMHAAHDPGRAEHDPDAYRRVALAVIRASRSDPPADFAAATMARLAARDAGVERMLSRGLFLVLTAAAVVVTGLYGGQWWRAMQAAPTGGALPWMLTGSACIALSWMLGQVHRLIGHPGD